MRVEVGRGSLGEEEQKLVAVVLEECAKMQPGRQHEGQV